MSIRTAQVKLKELTGISWRHDSEASKFHTGPLSMATAEFVLDHLKSRGIGASATNHNFEVSVDAELAKYISDLYIRPTYVKASAQAPARS